MGNRYPASAVASQDAFFIMPLERCVPAYVGHVDR